MAAACAAAPVAPGFERSPLEALGLARPGPETTILVLAPHPDDDVIGCGATIARLAAAGCRVEIAYVTDGAKSHVGSRAFPPARLRDEREREATAGAARLGVPASRLSFLRAADGGLREDGDAFARLVAVFAALMTRLRPAAVLGPWIRDGHGDHAATARAARAVLVARPEIALFEYDVWPSPAAEPFVDADAPARRVPTGAYRFAKAAALAEHRTQLGERIRDADVAFALPPALRARAHDREEVFLAVPPEARLRASARPASAAAAA